MINVTCVTIDCADPDLVSRFGLKSGNEFCLGNDDVEKAKELLGISD